MHPTIIQVADNFWNLRGAFKIGGFLDIGTHASLVRRANGKFILLDSYTLLPEVKQTLDDLTNQGNDIEAILNLHPFHTIHVEWMHRMYPKAKLYGSARHVARLSSLPWEKSLIEDPSVHTQFAEDLEFSIPRGVDFISQDEKVHFSSVLAFHRDSKTLHVDDTIMYMRMPSLIRLFGTKDVTRFHITLAKALEKRAGAAQDFRAWAEELVTRWSDIANLCTAHTGVLLARNNTGASVRDRILQALNNTNSILRSHERKYG